MIARFTLKGIDKSKMSILTHLFETWGVKADIKPALPDPKENGDPFAETVGMWEGCSIDAQALRRNARGGSLERVHFKFEIPNPDKPEPNRLAVISRIFRPMFAYRKKQILLYKNISMELLTSKYSKEISYTLSCYDRIILKGTLPEISCAQGMTKYLYDREIRIFDYPRFAEPYKEKINTHVKQLAKDSSPEIEFIRKSSIRKESTVSKKLEKRGNAPGTVCILSAMEGCPTYEPWHSKQNGKTCLRPDQGKCLHYYIYFIDEVLGYGYMRIPTWCPFSLQVYINGHNLLANELHGHGISHTMLDNSFDSISDPAKAQELADSMPVEKIHRRLEELTGKFCSVYREFNLRYHRRNILRILFLKNRNIFNPYIRKSLQQPFIP
jgi:hypothetical protein